MSMVFISRLRYYRKHILILQNLFHRTILLQYTICDLRMSEENMLLLRYDFRSLVSCPLARK